jgi:hypothetical protein
VSHKKSVKASNVAATPDVNPAADLDLALAAVADPTNTSPHRQTSVDPEVKVKSKSHIQRHATTAGYSDTGKHKGLTPTNDRLPSVGNELSANQKQPSVASEPPLTNHKQSPVKTADAAANSHKRSSKDDNNLQSEAA